MYRNENLDFDCGLYIDILEKEAMEIKRWFKTKFMRPRLPQWSEKCDSVLSMRYWTPKITDVDVMVKNVRFQSTGPTNRNWA